MADPPQHLPNRLPDDIAGWLTRNGVTTDGIGTLSAPFTAWVLVAAAPGITILDAMPLKRGVCFALTLEMDDRSLRRLVLNHIPGRFDGIAAGPTPVAHPHPDDRKSAALRNVRRELQLLWGRFERWRDIFETQVARFETTRVEDRLRIDAERERLAADTERRIQEVAPRLLQLAREPGDHS